MKITIEIDNKSDMEKLSALFKIFKTNKVKVISAGDNDMPITKGDKKIDPTGLFGTWAGQATVIRKYP